MLIALSVDLLLMRHGGPHKVSFRQAAWWSAGWVALALAFNAALWFMLDARHGAAVADHVAMAFFTGYLVEKSLAVENIFVFLMVFTYFAVPDEQRQRVLVIGVLGAIVLRAIMIFAGTLLLARFHWILYVFGAFLVLTGIKMLWARARHRIWARIRCIRWMRRHLRISAHYDGNRMLVRRDGATWVTRCSSWSC